MEATLPSWMAYANLALNLLLVPLLAILWNIKITVVKLELQATFNERSANDMKADMSSLRSETTAAALAASNAASHAALAASNAAAAIAAAVASRNSGSSADRVTHQP